MRLVINNISKKEAKEIVSNQWGATMWEKIDKKLYTYPTSTIEVSLVDIPEWEDE